MTGPDLDTGLDLERAAAASLAEGLIDADDYRNLTGHDPADTEGMGE